MNDKEFKELLERLYKLSVSDGDLGYEYWTKVIKQLKELRKLEAK